ncbi:MAG: SDR family NAD(P)-dependent oxidoreductase [Rhodobacter sp.]|uniref:type I polyketide synthase n=1 Tax=Pararhodobacter sp. TaxID=2127056 RepID=UPI002CC3DC03|nr:SDR family NAD(P)-dependent oxidoreductase [Pararhodobacter sp.]MCC0072358.1 SDR family NAD(P)-dependent oxidoreductase [Rhodobacter sp.]HPD91889.1 SDR family NAD(P)-dependent oxidoreductase [Pararhodobacter sp.]
MSSATETAPSETDLAIVGMAAHLPGAASIGAYWHNLRNGLRAIRRLSEDELIAAGEDPALMRQANYVPFAAPLDRFADFDAEFFGFSPKEAAILDPQHRQFLEVAWEALENAGHTPEGFGGTIGVYAGCGMGSYFYFNLCSNRDLVRDVGMFLLRHTGNDKDFLSTRVSHIFDLRGPSVNVQTACSTSLVALHYAAQALLSGECDMALAGGVTIELPQGRGYLYKENEILSPDGECHAFDHRAQGTVFGSGAGCVVLKRLGDAVADGDHIWAVVKGSAINNDGAQKAGYLAPSVEGQARCVAEAQAVADVPAETVDYIECHGTGTYLGDPIEVAAMTEAFRETTDATQFCRIGSVKTNIGHLDTAAGVASLIKVALALHHREMPPSLGFEAPNPTIDFESSPFAVNAALTPWESRGHPRRAGVNSLGVGGTNAHVILQEAPARAASEASDWPFQLLTLSARTRGALDQQAKTLAQHLRDAPGTDLADVAWTLHKGRRAFDKRRVVVAESPAEAAALLDSDNPRRVFSHTALDNPDVVFLFPGGGAQYAGMARDLYETEPVFAEWMDRGLEILQPRLDYDLRALWLPEPGAEAAADVALKRPSVQLPLIMITEYALAQMLMAWGVQPAALVGHSMGENTAACLAGVLSFEDCIGLVHLRGSLFDTVPAGGMLSVPLSVDALGPYLGDLDLASVNAPDLTVVSGPDAALDDLAARLQAEGVETQRIAIDIAAHSRMLEPILSQFRAYLASIPLAPPRLPIISNRTGQPLTAEQATSPDYWTQHLRGTVMFADCVSTLAETPNRIWIEVGPGKALSSLTRMHGAVPPQQVLAVLRHPDEDIADDLYHMGLLGRIWALGGTFDWSQIWGEARRNRVPLPTYPFERREYFIAPAAPSAEIVNTLPARIADVADMGTRLGWVARSADLDFDIDTDLDTVPAETWLVFADQDGIAAPVLARLRAAGHKVIEVQAGDSFRRRTETAYTLPTERGREGYDQLIQDLVHRGTVPTRIAHFWLASGEERFRAGSNAFQAHVEQGFYSLMFLGQAIGAEGLAGPIHLTVITAGAAQVRAEGLRWPEKAMIAGPARVIPHEIAGLSVSTLDIDPLTRRRGGHPDLVQPLLEELLATPGNAIAALRGGKRYEQRLRPQPLTQEPDLPRGAAWVITGGFGGIGQSVAEALIRRSGARIALISRAGLPPRDQWAALKESGDPAMRRILQVERLESLGAEVLVAAADVCNIDEMRAAFDTAKARFGRIHGVIHAAGTIDDAPLLAKTVGSVESVFAPKVHGTRVLDALLPDGAVDRIVVFSSTSTLTAPAGQVDYVAANEYLNAWARARTGKTRVTAIDWGIWAEVGMAAEAMAARMGQGPAMPETPAGVPLLDTAGFDAQMNRRFRATYSTDMWLLDEHRTKDGRALVPGTGILEIAAQSLHGQGEVEPFEIADLTFFRALEVDQPRAVEVTLGRSDAGYEFALRSEVTLRGRKGFALNASGRVNMGAIPAAAPLDVAAIQARCTRDVQEDAHGIATGQESHLAFGPRWRVLNRQAYGQGEGLAHLSLPPAFRDDLDQGYVLHPALTDLATGWAMGLIPGYQGRALWVPVSYGRVRVYRALPAAIVSHVRIAPAEPGFASFDITLATPDGTVCAEITRFTIKRLDGGFGTPAPLLPSEVAFDQNPADRALTPGEERFARNLAQGLTPAEGAEGFLRALATGRSQVVISSLTLPELIQEAAQPQEQAVSEGQKFERPNLDSDYLAPRNDVERMLVSMFEELLGVQGVGVQDSFFDLGGHSLIAVRLFARVKKTWAVDFPISLLFEAPTVEKVAARVAEVAGITETGSAPAVAAPQRRYEFLVPMHEGEGGPKTPFFLVAGMFGNVLNLRHLAQLLGTDRPFYGLQARGLLGGAEPHRRLDEAARDYLAEVRQVQPHGPYLLGGFSGGGLTALEMARQLRAAGEEVRLLTLLDTPVPMRPTLSRADKAAIKLAEFRRKGPGYLKEWLDSRRAWKAQEAARADEAAGEGDSGFHNRAIEAAFRDALPHVAMTPFDAPVALFRPPLDRHWKVTGGQWVSRAKEYVYDDNDWSRWMPRLSVHEVPGDHDSMVLEPNVRVMAAKLRALIAEAEA